MDLQRLHGDLNLLAKTSMVRSAPTFQSINRYNSATDCSISLTFATQSDHVTANTLQTFEVKGSKT